MCVRVFSFFFWFSFINYAFADRCAPAALVKPCVCTSNGADILLTCHNITKHTDLIDLIRRSEDYQFDYFLLKHSSIDFIPQQLITMKSFTSVRIIKSNLTDLFDEGSVKVESLEALILQTVSLKNGIRWEQFRNLQNLKRLIMKNVNVLALDDKFIDNMSRELEQLVLLRTNTSHINDNVFAKMSHLTDIIVQGNEITNLKRNMFPEISRTTNFFFEYASYYYYTFFSLTKLF
ncbi:hypothetical protein NPIL_522871 [Nephila pilipes]|uniref:Uncharacterized protein n=1 Tax=Nephila pilipes TaxID=299642 RepID=A0A8X6PCT1_NEPPI|nr:hypothetical protein NPIL_522871 [Nephila pilipes]